MKKQLWYVLDFATGYWCGIFSAASHAEERAARMNHHSGGLPARYIVKTYFQVWA